MRGEGVGDAGVDDKTAVVVGSIHVRWCESLARLTLAGREWIPHCRRLWSFLWGRDPSRGGRVLGVSNTRTDGLGEFTEEVGVTRRANRNG